MLKMTKQRKRILKAIMNIQKQKRESRLSIQQQREENKRIIENINKEIRNRNKLMKNEIEQQIKKLKEYRQSLIFEAVTGKIDVRSYVANN